MEQAVFFFFCSVYLFNLINRTMLNLKEEIQAQQDASTQD
jgi:hypothetical protein